MTNNLFAFICKLCLINHVTDINGNDVNTDQFLLKPSWTWTPPFTKNKELENLTRNLCNILFYSVCQQDNIKNLHKDLNEFILLTTSMKTIIKELTKEAQLLLCLKSFIGICARSIIVLRSIKRIQCMIEIVKNF